MITCLDDDRERRPLISVVSERISGWVTDIHKSCGSVTFKVRDMIYIDVTKGCTNNNIISIGADLHGIDLT